MTDIQKDFEEFAMNVAEILPILLERKQGHIYADTYVNDMWASYKAAAEKYMPKALESCGRDNSQYQEQKTLRDEFAMAALQGLLANSEIAKDAVKLKINAEYNQSWHAETAYHFADAMLKARGV